MRVVISRFMKSQVSGEALKAIGCDFNGEDGKKAAWTKAERIVEALSKVLSQYDGSDSKCTWSHVVDGLEGVATKEQMEAIVDFYHDKLKKANFTKVEVIAMRAYSGPLYVKMNSSLRANVSKEGEFPAEWTAHLKGNKYIHLIYACASGMRKMASVSCIPQGRKVYRGMGGVKLPDSFSSAGEDGACGGTEYGFMSTTTSKEVAVSYIGKKALPLIFEIELGAVDKGCPMSGVSQFPGENEVLIPALSHLEILGEPSVIVVDSGNLHGVAIRLYRARINCNLKSLTIEEIEARRKEEVLAMLPYLRTETQNACGDVRCALKQHCATYDETKEEDPETDFKQMEDKFKEYPVVWFHNDQHYKEAITEAIDFKALKIDQLVRTAYKYHDVHDTFASALHVAILRGADARLLKQLLEYGANVGALDQHRRTPFHYCVLAQRYNLFTVLLGAGADREVKDANGKRPLDLFAELSGRSELSFAAVLGDLERCRALVKEGADATAQGSDGATPMAMAILAQSHDIVLWLIRKRTESCSMPNLGPSFDVLARAFSDCFLRAECIAAWLREGISVLALKVEISCLLSLPSLEAEIEHKECLEHVRAFLNHHETLLGNTSQWPVAHCVQQLVSQEPDSVYSVFTHAEAVRVDGSEDASGATTPAIIQWVNKPQTPLSCRFTMKANDQISSLAYSKCGRTLARAEGDRVVVCDALTGLVQFNLTGHKQRYVVLLLDFLSTWIVDYAVRYVFCFNVLGTCIVWCANCCLTESRLSRYTAISSPAGVRTEQSKSGTHRRVNFSRR